MEKIIKERCIPIIYALSFIPIHQMVAIYLAGYKEIDTGTFYLMLPFLDLYSLLHILISSFSLPVLLYWSTSCYSHQSSFFCDIFFHPLITFFSSSNQLFSVNPYAYPLSNLIASFNKFPPLIQYSCTSLRLRYFKITFHT